MGAAIMPLVWVVFVLALGLGAAAVVYAERARREKVALRRLVDRLKDLAWDQRELDPHLSTIIIDEIRTYEKKELRG
jgi:CHASE1-domain containing sensor protein